jgi:hypothetical protein
MSVPELIGLIASVIAICELLYKVAVYLYQKKIFRWDILSHWQFKKINSSHGTFGHIVYLDGFAGPFPLQKKFEILNSVGPEPIRPFRTNYSLIISFVMDRYSFRLECLSA